MSIYMFILLMASPSSALNIRGQSLDEAKVSIYLQKATISQIFKAIEKQSSFYFVYDSKISQNANRISFNDNGISVRKVLEKISRKARLKFRRVNLSISVNIIPEKEVEIVIAIAREISGKVTDKNGEPLLGVNILVKGTNFGTSTDFDGNFTLEIPDDAKIIVVSYIGYKTQEIAVEEKSSFDIKLEESLAGLDEVVIVGYGTQSKRKLTQSISTIKGEAITKAPTVNLAASLTGKLSGVVTNQQSGQPGFDDVSFRIRGISSYRGNQSPLVIVDGIERPFSRINPNNVATLSVLKDASATSVYGRKGANGVVLITTKRGVLGKPTFNYTGRFGWQSQTRKVEVMNAGEFARYLNEAKANDGVAPQYTDQEVADYESGALPSYDWVDALLDNNAPQQQHNISASGGTEKTKFFASYGFVDQDGLFGTSFFKQNSFRVNLNTSFSNRFRARIDLLGRLEKRGTTPSPSDTYKGTVFANPTQNPFPDVPGVPSALGFNGFNGTPIGAAERSGTNNRDRNVFQSNFNLEYDILGVDGLTAEALYSYDLTTTKSNRFETPYSWYELNQNSNQYEEVKSGSFNNIVSSEQRRKFERQTLQLSLNYDKSFGDHSVSALFLYEQIQQSSNLLNASRRGFLSIAIPFLFAGNEDNDNNNSSATESASRGWVGRVTYDYMGKYLLSATARVDQSFTFAEEFRTGFFPAISAGWILSEESFLANSNLISFMKLFGSWGQTGNDNVGQFQYLSTYSFGGGTILDGASYLGIRSDGIPNPSITWETVTSRNIGLNANFLNDKFQFEFEYFWRTTTDILDTPAGVVPQTFGAGISPRPLGEFDSWGIETLLKHINTIGDDFTYGIEGNLTWFDNKTVKFNEPKNVNPALSRVGRTTGLRHGYISEGLFQSQEEIDNHATQFGTLSPGDIKYRDINGRDDQGNLTGEPDGKIDADDRTIIGESSFPNFVYGLNLTAEYKGFDIQANFQGASNFTRNIKPSPFERDGNSLRVLTDSWRPGNENAAYPRLAAEISNNREDSSFWITTVSYLRLRNLELGYNFDSISDVLERSGIQSLRLFFSGNNLFTLSNLDWRDPEGSSSNKPFYPQVKTISLGLSVEF